MTNNIEKFKHIPKAELHVHVDGTMTPALTLQMANEKGIKLPDHIFNPDKTRFTWTDFSKDFHAIFDATLAVMQSSEDFRRITYAYLESLAAQNTLYAELIVAPTHEGTKALHYSKILEGMVAAIDAAEKDFGIVARIIPAIMRHYGPEQGQKTMDLILAERHPYVVGVNLVGDIVQHEVKEFAPVFDRAKAAGLKINAHVGEASGGPYEIWQAINDLQVDRISHGVRAIEDKKLLQTIVDKQIPLEICPTSNILLHMYPDIAAHPLQQLHEAGVAITLNTDDPGFFSTTLSDEYASAQQYANFTDEDLIKTTATALNSSFVEPKIKQALLSKV